MVTGEVAQTQRRTRSSLIRTRKGWISFLPGWSPGFPGRATIETWRHCHPLLYTDQGEFLGSFFPSTPPFDPSRTITHQLQEAAPWPGGHCSFRDAMLFHKKAKGSLEPGTDPAPPANWRSPVKAVVTLTSTVQSMPPALSCLFLSPHHPSLTAHPSPARQEQRACAKRALHCDPTAPRSISLSARRPSSVDEDGIPWVFVGQDPPCVAFATADVPERQTQRRASNTHPQSQSTPTDRARGLPYRLVSPESRHAIADTWLEKLNSTERASGSPFAIFSVRPSILRQRDLVAIQSPCASQ